MCVPTTILHLREGRCKAVLDKQWKWKERHPLPFYCAEPAPPGATYCAAHNLAFHGSQRPAVHIKSKFAFGG